jgi:hypothetical protein
MTRAIRYFGNAARVRVLALLAWLLLVITPAYGMPLGATGGMSHGGHATLSMSTGGHCHHTSTSKADRSNCVLPDSCCAGHICQCATTCSVVLVAPGPSGIASAHPATVYESTPRVLVPSSDFIPLLRPPAA